MDVKLPNGVIIRNIPDGTTKDVIQQKAIASGLATEKDFIGLSVNEPHELNVANMFYNVPGSTAQLAKDIVSPFLHPGQTIKGFYGLARGLVEKLEPGTQENEKYVDAASEYFKKRYGSWDNIKKTMEADPVGFLSDFAGAVGLAPGKVGKFGRAVDPINMTINTAAKTVGKLTPRSMAHDWYKSAAKFGRTQKRSELDNNRIIDNLLDEGITPTEKGVNKAYDTIHAINSKIDNLIDAATNSPNGWVNSDRVFKYVDDVIDDLGGFKESAPRNIKAAQNVVDEFKDHLNKENITTVTARELQEFKKDLYQSIDFDIRQSSAQWGTNQMRRGMAKAAKEDIEGMVPEVHNLNAREGRILESLDPLEQAASRIERRDLMGIGIPIKAAAGEAMAPGGGWMPGAILGAMDTPKIKSGAAVQLRQLQNAGLLEQYLNNAWLPTALRQPVIHSGRQYREEEY